MALQCFGKSSKVVKELPSLVKQESNSSGIALITNEFVVFGVTTKQHCTNTLSPFKCPETPPKIAKPTDSFPVDVPGFADVAGLERVVDDLFQQVERGGIGRILAGNVTERDFQTFSHGFVTRQRRVAVDAAQETVSHGGVDGEES